MQLALLKGLKKYYGERLLLDIDKFEVLEGDRIGIVGENGAGKSTLIKILLGELNTDEGKVFLTDSYSYISQREDLFDKCNEGKIKKIFNAPEGYEDYLSGGEKVKMKIVRALEENKSLIIADEPTSNLDSSSIELLDNMLKNYNGSLLIISHDRGFLNALCNIIVELEDSKLKTYKGNYNDYIDLKEANYKKEENDYIKYIHEKNRLEKAINQKEVLRDRIKKTPKGMGQSEAKTIKMGDQRGKKNIDNNIKSIKSRIDHLQVKEAPKRREEIVINITPEMEIATKVPIEIRNLNLFAGEKLLISEINLSIIRGKKIAMIGPNGCGKTTLLKEIMKGNSNSIKLSNHAKIGYFDQYQNILKDEKTIIDNIKEESPYDETFIRINLGEFGFKKDSVYKVVRDLSGGERVKVAICKIILSRNNILILDEPTNYLDIKSMEALESALINTDKTILLVSHDKNFISNICDYIIEFRDNNIYEFDGTYTSYLDKKRNVCIDKLEKEHDDELLVLENRLAELVSLLSLEEKEDKKKELDKEYIKLLRRVRELKTT